MNSKNKTVIGVSIVAGVTADAIAGSYYFYGSDGALKRRKQLKSWMVSMKAEVMDKLDDVKDLNGEAYEAIVNTVAEKYKQLKNVDSKEVIDLASRMNNHWKDIKKDIEKATKQTVKATKKEVKKIR
jgi:phosphopantetheine adenylyltransferase